MSCDQVLEQIQRQYSVYVAEQEDSGSNHTYEEEQALLELVRRGEVEQVRAAVGKEMPSYPRVIEASEKKTEEYIAVITVALLARAVVENGISSRESFALADVCLKQIAQSADTAEVLEIRDSAVVAFTEMAAQRRGRRKSGTYVEESKSYIAANVFRKISVSDVAQELSLSPIYLERIFKEAEGISISRYIQKEKIGRSKNLLIYSDRSIMEISEYLGFNSQSHFGKVFKQETGMTPKHYRMEYHLNGF